jgi:dTDP-4-dehydrorhamnose reductase
MKLLLTGKNGQLGFELQRALAPLGDVVALDHAGCDLRDPDAIRRAVRDIAPAFIVNPAAYTAVDRAESDQETAFAVNATAVGILGEEAARIGACVIHYSTDYVFNGEKSTPYNEDDAPAPQSVYGRSKLAGEQALQASGANSLILRTSWVVGAHGDNFAKTMLRLASTRDSLSVVSDQFGAPTSAALLADVTAHLVRQAQQDSTGAFPFGLYHLAAGGETNWHEYACAVIDAACKAGRPLKVLPQQVQPILAAAYPTAARRPVNSRLDTQKLRDRFKLHLPHWREGLHHVLQQII